jgi:hypothetical protein
VNVLPVNLAKFFGIHHASDAKILCNVLLV